MSYAIGLGPTKTRSISETGYTSTIALQLTEKIIEKVKQASLSALTPLKTQAPLSPSRFQRYLDESAKEILTSRDDLIPAALKAVQSSFKYLNCNLSEIDEWSEETLRQTTHHLERNTRFESMPVEQHDFSCFRYALQRVGISFSKPIENGRILKKILSDHCTLEEEPQEGDLVLFSSGGKPLHLGIYHQGEVLSKEGNAAQVAYRRPIEDFVADYGKSFQYYRRGQS